MRFKVTRQFQRSAATDFATFVDLQDAVLFIKAKIAADIALKLQVIYRVTEFGDVIEEFDPSKMSATTDDQSTSPQSGARFSPTPLNTTLMPKGMPPKWVDDEDDEKK